jgi:carboxylesterase type B
MPYARGSRNIINGGHDVIVVTMNYRGGAFGFLPFVDLEKEGSLNAGVLDVAASFEWIRKHIHHFGGNPRQVTATGLSSGGSNYLITTVIISNLLVAKDGKWDLFDVLSI